MDIFDTGIEFVEVKTSRDKTMIISDCTCNGEGNYINYAKDFDFLDSLEISPEWIQKLFEVKK